MALAVPGGVGALSAITVVALDLMDTVVRDPYREALEAAIPLPLDEILARRDPDAWPRFERGEITEEEYWSQYDGIPVDVEAFHRTRREAYRILDGMEVLLDDLAGRVERVAATNYPVWVREIADGLLRGRFERVVASYEVGVRKPDAAFYDRLVAAAGAPAERILFVDDRPVNVAAAREAGMRAHRFVGAEDLRSRLRAEGVEVPARR